MCRPRHSEWAVDRQRRPSRRRRSARAGAATRIGWRGASPVRRGSGAPGPLPRAAAAGSATRRGAASGGAWHPPHLGRPGEAAHDGPGIADPHQERSHRGPGGVGTPHRPGGPLGGADRSAVTSGYPDLPRRRPASPGSDGRRCGRARVGGAASRSRTRPEAVESGPGADPGPPSRGYAGSSSRCWRFASIQASSATGSSGSIPSAMSCATAAVAGLRRSPVV